MFVLAREGPCAVVLLAFCRLVRVLDAVAMVDFLQLGEGIDFADVVERAFLYGYTVVVSADDAGNIVPEALLGFVIRVETCWQVDGELRARPVGAHTIRTLLEGYDGPVPDRVDYWEGWGGPIGKEM